MTTHKFSVGDRVRLVVSKYSGDVPPGIYTISRQLPVEANVCQDPREAHAGRPRAGRPREPAHRTRRGAGLSLHGPDVAACRGIP